MQLPGHSFFTRAKEIQDFELNLIGCCLVVLLPQFEWFGPAVAVVLQSLAPVSESVAAVTQILNFGFGAETWILDLKVTSQGS